MIIVVKCPGCKKPYELDGALAGKKSRCKQCGEIFRIPVPTARIIEPAQAPPTTGRSAPAAEPAWIATPVVDEDEVAHPPASAMARAARPAAREAAPAPLPPRASGPPVRGAPARPARPMPSDFDDDLPPPRRTSYRPKAARRRDDTDAGVRALIAFLALDVVATLGMFLYLVLVETDPRHAGLIYGMGFGITLIIAGLLAIWGNIWLLVIAFREDAMKGLFCMVVPFYCLYYAACRWNERRGTIALGVSPLLAVVINLAVAWLVASSIRERTPPAGISPDGSPPTVASNYAADPPPPQPDPTPAPGAPVAPVPVPVPASTSGRKADAAQVRRGDNLIRRGLVGITELTKDLATIHDEKRWRLFAENMGVPEILTRMMRFYRPQTLKLGPDEALVLKHRFGGEIRTAFTGLKNEFLRIKTVPGVGEWIDASKLAEIDEIIDLWSLKPGEEQMPDLVEPPAGGSGFGPRNAFGPGGMQPGGIRPGGPGFPPGVPGPGPGAFPPGADDAPDAFGRIPMSSNIVEQADRDYQSMRQVFGDRTASLIVNGLPTAGDPPAEDVAAAIKKRIDELAPSVRSMRGARINDRYEQAFGPVDDVQALALRIDIGAVKVREKRIEVDLDPKWAANVPRQPKATAGRPRTEDPEIPAGADSVTRSLIELKSSDPWKRRRAMERLQSTNADGRVDQVVAALIPQLEGDDGGLASEAAKALGVWRSPEAMNALIGRMSENRHFVRSDSIKALGKYRDIKAAQAIASVIKADIFATEEALKEMGQIAEPALIPLLRHPESMVRSRVCNILAVIGGHETLTAMKSLPADPDFGVRVAANRAAEEIVRRVGPLPRNVRGKAGAARTGGAGR